MGPGQPKTAPRRRWLRRIVVGLALLVIVSMLGGGLGGWAWLRRGLPVVRGSLPAPGLRAAVEVVRDDYGAPTITAASEHDLYYALGYVHAQDRFFQMEVGRRVAQGRMSELVGRPAL